MGVLELFVEKGVQIEGPNRPSGLAGGSPRGDFLNICIYVKKI